MTLEEMEAKILELNDQIKSTNEALEKAKSDLEERDKSIASLQKTNQELFIRCTNPDDKKDKKTTKTIAELAKEMRG